MDHRRVPVDLPEVNLPESKRGGHLNRSEAIGEALRQACRRSPVTLALLLAAPVSAQDYGATAPEKPAGLNFDVGVMFDDNVTRSFGAGQKLSDSVFTLNGNKSQIVPLGDNTRMVVTGFVGAERYRKYIGLSRVFAGVQGQYQYRPSADFDSPIYALLARVSGDGYETAQRDGTRYSLALTYRKPLTDRIELFAALTRNQRHTASQVFSTRETSIRANLDYAWSSKVTLFLTGEYRRGDVVSTGLPTLANVDVATAITRDNAFSDTARFAYRTNAETGLATFGLNYAIDEKHALDFSMRRVKSTPFIQPNYNGAEHVSYSVTQFSLAYLFSF